MRGSAVGGALAAWCLVAGCSLGIVDLAPEPSPADLLVVSELSPDADPSLVRVEMNAMLKPGIGFDRVPRGLVDDAFGFESTLYDPENAPGDDTFRWQASQAFPTPGPEAIRLRLPRLEGLPAPREINMRVRVDVTPTAGEIVLAPSDDLVLAAAAPTNPSSYVSWYVDVRSTVDASFRLRLTGDGEEWPDTVRVPGAQLPSAAAPFSVRLGIQWKRTLNLSEVTPMERYDLQLQSILLVDWRVARS